MMSIPREGHSSTLLLDGRVLLCGGGNNLAFFVSSCELFDASNGSFSQANTMNVGRREHTATLLLDGRLLICGGYGGQSNQLSSCELFEPASATSEVTASMPIARRGHTATRLLDGRVLLCGGSDSLASCDLYDPQTRSFVDANITMSDGRVSHTQTIADSGLVFVCGGLGAAFRFLRTCEIFDPLSLRFVATLNMTTPRSEHSATLLRQSSLALFCGGFSSLGNLVDKCDVLDLVTLSFSPTAPMVLKRFQHGMVLLNNSLGLVLICGGEGTPKCELFDPQSLTFVPTADMLESRASFSFVSLSATTAVVCGGSNLNALSSCVSWTSCGSVSASSPAFVCSSSFAQLHATFTFASGPAVWSVSPSSVGGGVFDNASSPGARFFPTFPGQVNLQWSTLCMVKRTLTVVAFPTASFLLPLVSACGVSVDVGVKLSGDASNGLWSGFAPGALDNEQAAFVTFTWSPSQIGTKVNLSFMPNSVCLATSSVVVDILPSCPSLLSQSAIIGLAVGSAVAVIIAVIASVLAYRFWNRSRVNISKPSRTESGYKF